MKTQKIKKIIHFSILIFFFFENLQRKIILFQLQYRGDSLFYGVIVTLSFPRSIVCDQESVHSVETLSTNPVRQIKKFKYYMVNKLEQTSLASKLIYLCNFHTCTITDRMFSFGMFFTLFT